METIYFKKGIFTGDNNTIYDFVISENDRFYHYIKPYIEKGMVESATPFPIDRIVITDINKTFFENTTLTLQARMMSKVAVKDAEIIISKNIKIENIAFDATKSTQRCYENGKWQINLGTLKIPYNAEIIITEC